MAENKTSPTKVRVTDFLAAIAHPRRRADAVRLDALFRDVTGFVPQMWGAGIIGYGRYHYRYKTGREGDMLATGFAPRATNQVIYIMPGYADLTPILDRLGKWKKGKSCLYINKLEDIDMGVLAELIRAGLDDLGAIRPVEPS